jgi:hypothetical protein
MTQNTKKIQGTFYPLTPDMGQRLRNANLTAAEWRLWSYLVEIDPFGDRYFELPDTLSIMQVCNIKKTSFYKAMAKFQSLELFDFQNKGFFVRNLGFPQKRKTVRKNGKLSEKTENCPQTRKTVLRIAHQKPILAPLRLFRLIKPPRPSRRGGGSRKFWIRSGSGSGQQKN